MNLKELSQLNIQDINLKNINADVLKAYIKKNVYALIITVLVVLTIATFFGAKVITNQKSVQLDSEIQEMSAKLDAYHELKDIQAVYGEFTQQYPKVLESEDLIATVSNFAINREIRIVSFSPARSQENDFMALTAITINISTDNYNNIILFLHDIETSEYAVRLNRWISSTKGNARQTQPDGSKIKPMIQAIIEIGAIKLKNV